MTDAPREHSRSNSVAARPRVELSKTMSEACEPTGAGRVCPACGSESGRERGRKQGFALASCAACGTLYTSELPASHDYDGYYGAHNLDVPAFVHRRHAQIVRGFAPYRRTGRLLDVGYGAGSVMEVARAAGWEAQGVEVAREAVEHARSLGLEVFHGELAAARYPANHFDVAVAVEVLEHVPDPRALLLEIARVLRPGGLLWATTPHARGASARLLGTGWSLVAPPDHLHLFSRRGVKLLLRESGFRRSKVATHGVNPFEIVEALRARRGGAGARSDHDTAAVSDGAGFNRLQSSYSLNERLTRNRALEALKGVFNAALNVTGLGDSLKIYAEK